MMALVSTMAEEMQFFRSKINEQNNVQNLVIDRAQLAPHTLMNNTSDLIEVSDDEDETDIEGDDESEDESNSESDGEDDVDSDDDNESDNEDLNSLTFDLEHPEEISDVNNIKSIMIDESIHEPVDFDINDSVDLTKLPIPHLKDELETEDLDVKDETKEIDDNLKSISIPEINDLDTLDENVDYKKLSLNKLRDMAVKRKLVNDASKMKKPELVKLLGFE
jgi:hypothetical protein